MSNTFSIKFHIFRHVLFKRLTLKRPAVYEGKLNKAFLTDFENLYTIIRHVIRHVIMILWPSLTVPYQFALLTVLTVATKLGDREIDSFSLCYLHLITYEVLTAHLSRSISILAFPRPYSHMPLQKWCSRVIVLRFSNKHSVMIIEEKRETN